MRSQRIRSKEVQSPDELESINRELHEQGYGVARGDLGFYLANYDKEFSKPEEDAELKALYSSIEVSDQPQIEFILEYDGDFTELEDYYSEVAKARSLQ